MQIEEILRHFENPRKSGQGWTVRCPTHEDKKNSLCIAEANGKCLLKCQAGCETKSILAAVGLKFRDLSDNGKPPRDDVVARYLYTDEHGKTLFRVCRTASKKFFQERFEGDAFKSGLGDTRRVLYRLPELAKAKSVSVVEGEKDVETLRAVGLVATTNPMGAGKWDDRYAEFLRGKRVAIIPDNDKPGRAHAQTVAKSILAVAELVRIVELPDVPAKGDVSDYLAQHTKDELIGLIRATKPFVAADQYDVEPDPPRESEDENSHDEKKPKKSQADALVEIATNSGANFFHTPINEPFVAFSIDDHREVWPVRSRATRRWITRVFYNQTRKAPTGEALQNALNVLEAMAHYEGKENTVHLRTAWHGGRTLYYDLSDPSWRSVRIDENGWEVVNETPVFFRRYDCTAAQVEPAKGGTLDDLWNFLNVSDARIRRLIEAWVIAGMIPDIPRPLLAVYGDHGSAKSSACKVLLHLIDPNVGGIGKDEIGIVQGLAHRFAAVLENLSHIGDWLSDALSRAVTGEGFSKRQLYTDEEEIIFSYRRLILVNSIGAVISKADLLDRTLIIDLERIPDDRRKQETEFWQQFEKARPLLLGAMFDRLAGAIKHREQQLTFSTLPRLADFAAWAMADRAGRGLDHEVFLADFAPNIEEQNEHALAESITATVLLNWLAEKEIERWSGQPYELHGELKQHATAMKVSEKEFPSRPATLSKRLKEIRPNLTALGWDVDLARAKSRVIRITRNNRKFPDATDATDAEAVSGVSGVSGVSKIPVVNPSQAEEDEGDLLL
jgi:hypothetical protein